MKAPPVQHLAAALLLAVSPLALQAQAAPEWDVLAVRYATLRDFRVSGLVAGADTSRRMDIAMMFWLMRGANGRIVLVDAGFKRQDLINRWKPAGYLRPDLALARAGVDPSGVTDIIVTHVHWDHFGGADLFPNARIWIQREEVDHHVDAAGGVRNRAIDGPGAAMLHALRAAGRLTMVDGDDREIIPGITVYTGGKHTFQSQYAAVRTAAGRVVVASDNLYLYENLEKHIPIAQTLDPASNLAAHARMLTLASTPRLVVPGHDPLVFERFERVSPGVARIR